MQIVLITESWNEILKYDDLNEDRYTEQYFPVALFIVWNEVVITF